MSLLMTSFTILNISGFIMRHRLAIVIWSTNLLGDCFDHLVDMSRIT